MSDLWVAELHVSDRTRQKIAQKHGIAEEEVRDAVVCVRDLEVSWDDDAERGVRAIVEAPINGRRAVIVLFPAASAVEDTWSLGSAYFSNRH